MQQAPDYAELLDVPFAYRSNGRPHPTLAEQHHIIAYVAHRMFVVDALQQPLAAVRATTAIFLSALPATTQTPAPATVSPRRPARLIPFPYFATDGAYTRASSNMSRSRSR